MPTCISQDAVESSGSPVIDDFGFFNMCAPIGYFTFQPDIVFKPISDSSAEDITRIKTGLFFLSDKSIQKSYATFSKKTKAEKVKMKFDISPI